ncbi:hypothetical protein ACFL7D_01345 [candidate division KSB1 bacterium]
MAEILDQSEIDALLNSTFEGDDSDIDETEEQVADLPKPKKGFFKPAIKPNLHFDFRYTSPVLKSENILLNPTKSNEDFDKDKLVVRSVINYSNLKHKDKQH